MKYGVDVERRLVDYEHYVYREIERGEQGLVRLEVGWYLRSGRVNWLVWGRARLMSEC
jgi:hypothetical protein